MVCRHVSPHQTVLKTLILNGVQTQKVDKRFAVVIVAGVIVAASAGLGALGIAPDGPRAERFSYTDTNKDLQLLLADGEIQMSSPLRLNGFSIEKYCTFFSDGMLQKSIQYCTSTELLDSQGRFLGNIQMVGSAGSPEYVIAAVQTDSGVSRSDDLKTVLRIMVENLVCQCWEEESPGGFATVSDWVDAVQERHAENSRSTTKSDVSGLAGRGILLEVTTNQEGYLWKFVVS